MESADHLFGGIGGDCSGRCDFCRRCAYHFGRAKRTRRAVGGYAMVALVRPRGAGLLAHRCAHYRAQADSRFAPARELGADEAAGFTTPIALGSGIGRKNESAVAARARGAGVGITVGGRSFSPRAALAGATGGPAGREWPESSARSRACAFAPP